MPLHTIIRLPSMVLTDPEGVHDVKRTGKPGHSSLMTTSSRASVKTGVIVL